MYNLKGIDISRHQNPESYPYAQARAEGFSFAIIRAGYGTSKDIAFEKHYSNCKNQGFNVGAYWFTYAGSVKEAQDEANAFVNAIKGKQFEYPVYLDIEHGSILEKTSKKTRDEIIRTFGKTLESAGYYFGVYTNRAWFDNHISGTNLNRSYDWWIADWRGKDPQGLNYGLWQYGGSSNPIRPSKIGEVVTDQNFAVKDYPTIMKSAGLNGFTKSGATKPVTPSKKPIQQIAQEVIAGRWGNGTERQRKLTFAGYNYTEVQKIVNNLLGVTNGIKVGDRVKITGTYYATGEKIPFWVKLKTHTVDYISGDRARLREIWSWVNIKDLKK